MKTYKTLLFICLAQVFLSGCDKKSPYIEDGSLRVKVHNSSNYTIKNISIVWLKIEEYLLPGESSSVYKYKPLPNGLDRTIDRAGDSVVVSMINLDIGDYKAGREFDLYIDKILNNVYVSADSVNDELGPRIIITVRVE